jgi:hypothetical protein
MTQTELLPENTTGRPERDGRQSGMVLIRVPEVRIRPRSRPRIGPGRMAGRRIGARRPRRRLRREIRMAAYATLAFAPILLAAGAWCLHPTRPLAAAEVSTSPRPIGDDPEPAAVLISIEPAVGSNDAEVETPVVFPGYILPDDHREEPAHEGS